MRYFLLFWLFCYSSFVHASEESLYNFNWLEDDEQVYIIQNKEFTKKGGIGVDIGLIQSNNSPYYDSTGYLLSVSYYLTEKFSLELSRRQYQNSQSQDLKNLLEAYENQAKPILRVVNSANLLHFNWIPFYGKINVFNKVFFFDLGLGIGAGTFETEGNYKTFSIKNQELTLEKEMDSGANLKLQFKFFTRSRMTFGFTYNLTAIETIKSEDEQKQLVYYVDYLANIGYIF